MQWVLVLGMLLTVVVTRKKVMMVMGMTGSHNAAHPVGVLELLFCVNSP